MLPPLPRQGLSLLREQTLSSGKGPGREVCISEQESGKENAKDRREHPTAARGGSRCRCAGTRAGAHTGKPEPPSAVCWQTQLDLSTSCYTYPAATASKRFCQTVGTAHTPSF